MRFIYASFTFSLTLKEYSTYPDVALVTVNGEEQIHVIFDRDRYGLGKVYHTVFTEEYLKENNGKVFTPDSDFTTVAKIVQK